MKLLIKEVKCPCDSNSPKDKIGELPDDTGSPQKKVKGNSILNKFLSKKKVNEANSLEQLKNKREKHQIGYENNSDKMETEYNNYKKYSDLNDPHMARFFKKKMELASKKSIKHQKAMGIADKLIDKKVNEANLDKEREKTEARLSKKADKFFDKTKTQIKLGLAKAHVYGGASPEAMKHGKKAAKYNKAKDIANDMENEVFSRRQQAAIRKLKATKHLTMDTRRKYYYDSARHHVDPKPNAPKKSGKVIPFKKVNEAVVGYVPNSDLKPVKDRRHPEFIKQYRDYHSKYAQKNQDLADIHFNAAVDKNPDGSKRSPAWHGSKDKQRYHKMAKSFQHKADRHDKAALGYHTLLQKKEKVNEAKYAPWSSRRPEDIGHERTPENLKKLRDWHAKQSDDHYNIADKNVNRAYNETPGGKHLYGPPATYLLKKARKQMRIGDQHDKAMLIAHNMLHKKEKVNEANTLDRLKMKKSLHNTKARVASAKSVNAIKTGNTDIASKFSRKASQHQKAISIANKLIGKMVNEANTIGTLKYKKTAHSALSGYEENDMETTKDPGEQLYHYKRMIRHANAAYIADNLIQKKKKELKDKQKKVNEANSLAALYRKRESHRFNSELSDVKSPKQIKGHTKAAETATKLIRKIEDDPYGRTDKDHPNYVKIKGMNYVNIKRMNENIRVRHPIPQPPNEVAADVLLLRKKAIGHNKNAQRALRVLKKGKNK